MIGRIEFVASVLLCIRERDAVVGIAEISEFESMVIDSELEALVRIGSESCGIDGVMVGIDEVILSPSTFAPGFGACDNSHIFGIAPSGRRQGGVPPVAGHLCFSA